jgi:hypothetical protein
MQIAIISSYSGILAVTEPLKNAGEGEFPFIWVIYGYFAGINFVCFDEIRV